MNGSEHIRYYALGYYEMNLKQVGICNVDYYVMNGSKPIGYYAPGYYEMNLKQVGICNVDYYVMSRFETK
jgi:hypothetical protein